MWRVSVRAFPLSKSPKSVFYTFRLRSAESVKDEFAKERERFTKTDDSHRTGEPHPEGGPGGKARSNWYDKAKQLAADRQLNREEMKQMSGRNRTRIMAVFFIPLGASLAILFLWGIFVERERHTDPLELYHAWLASYAAAQSDAIHLLSRSDIAPYHNIMSVATTTACRGDIRIAVCETSDTIYFGIGTPRGPVLDTALSVQEVQDDDPDASCRLRAHPNLDFAFVRHIPHERVVLDCLSTKKRLVFTGHGVGGTIAQLVTLKLYADGKVDITTDGVRGIGFGSLPLATEKLREMMLVKRIKTAITTVINKQDPVHNIVGGLAAAKSKGEVTKEMEKPLKEFEQELEVILHDAGQMPVTESAKLRRQAEERLQQLWVGSGKVKGVKTLMRGVFPEWRHFHPFGHYLFIGDKWQGRPQVDTSWSAGRWKDKARSVWREQQVAESFQELGAGDGKFVDHSILSYHHAVRSLCQPPPDSEQVDIRIVPFMKPDRVTY